MTVTPEFGNFTSIVGILQPSFTSTTTFSVFGGIDSLLEEGKYFIAAVVLLFSIIFPVIKLTVVWIEICDLFPAGSKFARVLERFGKYSMVDVFVMALLILAVKGLPGGSSVSLEWGLACFGAAALLTIELARLAARARRD
jgi:paraquat-inducible protein A